MPTAIQIKGKTITRPGVYTDTRSGINNPKRTLSYGNVCIIDTNLSSGWAAGAGVNGELTNDKNAVYAFDSIDDFRKHVKGGYLWLLAEALFLPDGNNGVPGVSRLYFIKAATTTASSVTLTLANGSLSFKTKDEGTGANGVLSSGVLTQGYAVKLVSGIQDPNKFILQFYVSSFKGLDSQNGNAPYDGVPALSSVAKLLAYTDEFSSIEEIISWCSTNYDFNQYFQLTASTATPIVEVLASASGAITAAGSGGDVIVTKVDGVTVGTFTTTSGQTQAQVAIGVANSVTGYTATYSGSTVTLTGLAGSGSSLNTKLLTFTITGGNGATATGGTFTGGVDATSDSPLTSADLLSYPTYEPTTGATESFASQDFDDALAYAKDLDNTFFLSTDYGANGASLSNTKILDLISNQTKYEKYMYVGGGFDKNTFKGIGAGCSEAIAKYFDSDNAIVVHGGSKRSVFGTAGFKTYDQLYKTCCAIGRTSGLAPQIPITLKSINIDGEVHSLTEKEQEFCLANGILYSYYDDELGGFVLGQGINTLQNNSFLVNEDGSSFSIAVKRITTQLTREVLYYAKQTFFGSENGPNRNTITDQDIKVWLEGFLKSRTATTGSDNLILRGGNVKVEVQQDNYFVSFEFVPNFEISKIVFIGFILDK